MWTIEREVELSRLVLAGYSAGKIASMWGWTRAKVGGKIDRMGLTGPNATKKKVPRKFLRKFQVKRVPKPPGEKRKYVRGKPLPPKPVVLHHDAPPSLNISLADLSFHHCRWIEGEPTHEATYCGHHAADGRYCEYHHKLAYTPIKPRTNAFYVPGPKRGGAQI